MKNLFYSALMLAGVLFMNSCSKDEDGGGGGNSNPTVASLNCATATVNPTTAFTNNPYTGTASVSYTGGNGVAYAAGTAIASTGVTGLTATLSAGTLINGAGNVVYNITGTPGSAGTATFPISFGGQSCNLTLTVSNPPLIVGKWYYEGRTDSAYCCLPGARSGAAIVPYTAADSTINRTFSVQNTYYYDFKVNNTFTELYLDDSTYNGSYTYGYSAVLGADSLNANYSDGGVQRYRINSISPTQLLMRERTFYILGGRGILGNGDTLVYRLIWKFKK